MNDTDNNVDTQEDYIFRFQLDNSDETPVYEHPVTEMVRSQLAALLDVVVLTEKGQTVKVDGFKFLNNLETTYEIFKKDM